ncbi:MAG: 4Fe-4S binding protein [Mariniphaga sp.]|nr:4Fe-4S binding protein [Mariniphaga sp.]
MKRHLFTSNKIRLVSSALAVVFALPLFWKGLAGLYTWFSPFILLHSVIVLKSFVWMNFLGMVVLVFSFMRKRWFCRYMCPVGYGCDLVSKYSIRRNFKLSRVPDFSKGLAIASLVAAAAGLPLFILLDPMALFHGFFSVFSGNKPFWVIVSFSGLPVLLAIHLFIPGVWCARICPLGGLQDLFGMARQTIRKTRSEKKRNSEFKGSGRRLFIASGLGIASGLLIPRYLHTSSYQRIRPPASLPSDLFNVLCIRCSNCVKACPTQIIDNNTDTSDPVAWMTPVVHFENSYCLENCNFCGRVCPTGAISPFSIDAKKKIVMALAVVHLEACLLTKRSECDRCKEACKYDAIKIEYLAEKNQMAPVVDNDKCIGCGACAVICPPFTIDMIPPEEIGF